MLFLSLYTPATPPKGPPSAEHMAEMGKLIDDMTTAGVLVTTGGIMSRNTAMKVTRRNGAATVEDGPVPGSSLMPAAGYAVLSANSREELARHIKSFLNVVGDGSCEIIQLMDGPPPQN
jgi:hypothetical protein